MTEIQNLSSVCRCCHAESDLKPLDKSYVLCSGNVVVFSRLLFDTLGVTLSPSQCTDSNSICDNCIYELQKAADFKAQVLDCERRFLEYCINELQPDGVKQELNLEATDEDSDGDNDLHAPSHLDDDNDNVEPDLMKQEEMLPTEDDVINDNKVEIGIDLNDERKEKDNETLSKAQKGTLKKKKNHINKEKWMKCIDCDKRFATELKLNRHYGSQHMRRLNKSVAFQCDYCRKEFKSKSVLRIHIIKHLGRKNFCCEMCGRGFFEATNLNKHKSTVHFKERPYECNMCPKRYAAKKSLVIHQLYHTGIRPFKCRLCPRTFTSSRYLKNHTLKHNTFLKIKKTDTFTCSQCKEAFLNRSQLRTHFQMHIGNLPFKCAMCPKDFSNKYGLKKHIEMHEGKKGFASESSETENGTLKEENEANWIKCIDCDKRFATKKKLNKHYGSKHKKVLNTSVTYQCDYCKKEFQWKSVLQIHILKHLGLTKNFYCEMCGRGFFDVTNLNRHISTVHLKERPYACKICPKRYMEKKGLVIHQNHHDGIKPFKCKLCHKEFTTSYYLNIHTLKHKNSPFLNNADTFTCTQCKEVFLTRGELRIHFKIHIGNLPFKCAMCPRDFTNKYCLNRHIATHEGNNKFTCDICCKKLTTKVNLLKHKMNVHDPSKLEALSKRISTKCNICNRMVKDINKHKISHLERHFKCPDCDKAYPKINALNRHVQSVHFQNRKKKKRQKRTTKK